MYIYISELRSYVRVFFSQNNTTATSPEIVNNN